MMDLNFKLNIEKYLNKEQFIEQFKKEFFENIENYIEYINQYIEEELNLTIYLDNDDNIVNIFDEDNDNIKKELQYSYFEYEVEKYFEEIILKYEKNISSWLEYEIDERFKEIIFELSKIVKNDKIKIYRGMSLNKNNNFLSSLNNKSNLGIFWTTDKYVTNEFSSNPNNYNKILLEAKVHIKEIDWNNTIKARLGNCKEEKEITLFPQSKIKLLKVFKNDKRIKLPLLKDNIKDINM